MKRQTKSNGGHTLFEVIAAATIMGIVGLVAALVITEAMRIYARTSPAMHAEYQARLATERMQRDIRRLRDADSIAAITPTAFAFTDEFDQPLSFKLSGGDLYRNDDLLARGLTDFAFTYWNRDGQPATSPSELHLVEVDLTVQVAKEVYRAQTIAFPRCEAR